MSVSSESDDNATVENVHDIQKQNGSATTRTTVEIEKLLDSLSDNSTPRKSTDTDIFNSSFGSTNLTKSNYRKVKFVENEDSTTNPDTTNGHRSTDFSITSGLNDSKKSYSVTSGSNESKKGSQIWDGLDDIQVLKSKERKINLRGKMSATVEPATSHTMERSISLPSSAARKPDRKLDSAKSSDHAESIHDLVPAGLVKASDNYTIVEPKYSQIGESLIRNTPHEMQCSMFCGGKRCKYESATSWSEDDMAIKGIFSHWITDDIIAMSRPNTQQMVKNDIIGQFNKYGIKSIVNLQISGEHASCGPKLESSGFTYDPNDFMKNKIFFYNFEWKDHGETSMTSLLDMVKVLSFALTEGKVAVHCHAGLGRTGVLLSCYLVYYLRVRSNDAIRYVRLKRPNAVQTRRQIANVKEFETFFLPQCLVFSTKPPGERDKRTGRFNLDTCLKRQKFVVHGFEARALKHIPKLLYVICERLIGLCDYSASVYDAEETNFTKNFLVHKFKSGADESSFRNSGSLDNTPNDSITVTRRSSNSLMLDSELSTATTTPGATRPSSETNSLVQSCSSAISGVDDKRLDEILADGIKGQTLEDNKVTKELAAHLFLLKDKNLEHLPIYSSEFVYRGLVEQHNNLQAEAEGAGSRKVSSLVREYTQDLNFKVSAWDRLATETNVTVLATLLLDWLEHLKTPLLDRDSITLIVIQCENMEKALKKLPNHQAFIMEYLIRFVARLQPLQRSQAEVLMKRLIASLTHQSIPIEGTLMPAGKNFPKLRGGTMNSCLTFMMAIYDVIVKKEGYAEAGDILSKSIRAKKIIETSKSEEENKSS